MPVLYCSCFQKQGTHKEAPATVVNLFKSFFDDLLMLK